MNNVILVGRLVKNPVMIDNNNARIVLEVSRRYKNDKGIYETDLINCILWNAVASNTCEYCHCGDVIGIKGRIESKVIKDIEDNDLIISEVVAEKITFLTSNKKEE